MDKKTIPIIVILVVVLLFWSQIVEFLGLYKPAPPPPPQEMADTTRVEPQQPVAIDTATPPATAKTEVKTDTALVQQVVAHDTITVTTEKYVVTLTTFGGGPVSMILNEYDYRDSNHIEMLPDAKGATPTANFAGGQFSTSDVSFSSSLQPGAYRVTDRPLVVSYTYAPSEGAEIKKTYTFYPDTYHYDLILEVNGLPELGFDRLYNLVWNTPLGVTEPQAATDYDAMEAVAMQAGSRVSLKDFDDGRLDQTLTGSTSWAGLRSKYFSSIMIPRNRQGEAVFAKGEKFPITTPHGKTDEKLITVGLDMPFTAMSPGFVDSFTVFVGPMDYTLLSEYDVGLEDMLDIGTTPFVGWIIKPFAVGVIWLLPKMYAAVPNYGVVIILFAILVKLVTLPLSMKSFKSMNAMKELQPKIEELKQKHKKNPQALNAEMMKLYKAHGVNPMSGCLPILPQMPLFIAMFSVFRSTILLRDAPFVWFVTDLSRGATGFFDPYIILVIIMVAAQFVSQKFTMSSTQQNKALMYMMPLIMGFFFYTFPAGLVLYWTCFSILSLVDYLAFKRNKKNPQVQTA